MRSVTRDIAAFGHEALARVRPCEGCGYDLRGLPMEGVCPECGLPKTVANSASIADPLSAMPIALIKQFRTACTIASVVLLAVVAIVAWSVSAGIGQTAFAVLQLTVSAAWVAAVVLLTPALGSEQGVSRGFSALSRWRLAARWLQSGWIAAGLCAVAIALLPAPGAASVGLLAAFRVVFIAIGLAGVWCLAVLMSNLAEWARDDFAERVFNLSLWGIPIGTPPLLFFNLGWLLGLSYPVVMMRGPAAVGIILVSALWAFALLTFPIAMFSLAKSVALSVVHSRELQARRKRQLQRTIEYDQRISESIERMDRPA